MTTKKEKLDKVLTELVTKIESITGYKMTLKEEWFEWLPKIYYFTYKIDPEDMQEQDSMSKLIYLINDGTHYYDVILNLHTHNRVVEILMDKCLKS